MPILSFLAKTSGISHLITAAKGFNKRSALQVKRSSSAALYFSTF
jgi:hypothetical protein